jgi:hypothetical protein
MTVFIHSTREQRYVKDGFNWLAFFFGYLWAFSEGLVSVAGRLFAIDVFGFVLIKAYEIVNHSWLLVLSGLILIITHVVSGCIGSDWLRASLLRQGYKEKIN